MAGNITTQFDKLTTSYIILSTVTCSTNINDWLLNNAWTEIRGWARIHTPVIS